MSLALARLMRMQEALEEMKDEAQSEMREIESIAKEVGGKASKSPRYAKLDEIAAKAGDLIAIYNNRFTYTRAADSVDG